jgi:hypothetical protein
MLANNETGVLQDVGAGALAKAAALVSYRCGAGAGQDEVDFRASMRPASMP